jgi:hypothetical protein
MAIPRQRGKTVYTCRNGHRFVWEMPRRRSRWRSRTEWAVILMVVFVLALILAARYWPTRIPFLHSG